MLTMYITIAPNTDMVTILAVRLAPPITIRLSLKIAAIPTTPPAIIAQLNRQIAALLQSPDIRERLAVQGLEAASNSPAEFRSYIASEVRKWAVVIKQAGVVAD